MDLPEIVYKYRDWANEFHRRILTHNEIYLPCPAEFNDPFDCKIPPNFISLDSEEKIRAFVTKQTIRHFEILKVEGRDIQFEMRVLEDRLRTDIIKFQEDYEEGLFTSQNERLGIFSLSERWNSILMWSHYANKHQGLCIGFHEEKLRESGIFGRGSQVSYNPNEEYEFPFIDPVEGDNVLKYMMETSTKAYDWHYEKEYRLFKSFYDEIPSKEDRIVKIDDNSFAEVNIGLNTSKSDKEQIISICKSKSINVFKVEKVPFKFMLCRKPI